MRSTYYSAQLTSCQSGAQQVDRADASCSHDLIESSGQGSRPKFSNFYTGTFESIGTTEYKLYSALQDVGSPGSGFQKLDSAVLPDGIAQSLTRLAIIDRMMAMAPMHRVDDRDYNALVSARKDCHHGILSLPPWDDLSDSVKNDHSRLDYEICRIVAILYSTAVLFPVSPQYPWLSRMLGSLRRLFQDPGIYRWLLDSNELAVWALFIASIAAYPTQQSDFFCRHLKNHLLATERVSFAAVRSLLKQYVWSDSACELGASMVWNKLDLNREFAIEREIVSSGDV